jgi:hypothetical protein
MPVLTNTYNGWTNYETWLVNLWLTNEPYSYDMLQHIIEAFHTLSEQASELELCITSDDNYLGGESSLWSDLLHSVIARVDWREIVEKNCE